ncbi:PDR/VanB family oxidoreductase [Variovorax saccharolyticus]|uniref:PDR/VanB family oxidoreductase n=1 Tax=Variovorax saccharolyticus TaxID=3053516 RepID=UPI002575B8F0|nr:PDR/VanB family oxidoreductase [Variovorax sp. J31P216]MDM0025193.1 PDR/VanB family oxidoreductase [Variovorax sp. J31P216]
MHFFDLRCPRGGDLPAFQPGAHIDLHLPGALQRSYSLLNDCRERHRYVIAVKRERASRGGSAWLHEGARAGALIEVSAPANHFVLDEGAHHSIFVAGGIGITPLWAMIQRLEVIGNPWTLHYRASARVGAALVDELTRPRFLGRVHLSFADEAGAARLDIAQAVARAPHGAHFYCCGPVGMLEAFESACAGISPDRVHLEYFAAKEAPATAGGFTVHLARTGRSVRVPPGKTILESLAGSGLSLPSSCQQGVCGICETRVLSGQPDHRDIVLSESEKAAGRTLMICCSGSKGPDLTLDI